MLYVILNTASNASMNDSTVAVYCMAIGKFHGRKFLQIRSTCNYVATELV